MFTRLKLYFIGDILKKENDTIKRANAEIVFYLIFFSLVLLGLLQLFYLINGAEITQMLIGCVSISIFLIGLISMRYLKTDRPVAYLILIFSTLIFAANMFMYPETTYVNILLLGCNVIFAINFFVPIIGLSFCLVHIGLVCTFIFINENNIVVPFITVIHQPMVEQLITTILLFFMLVLIVLHYQAAHKNAAIKLVKLIADLQMSEYRRIRTQKAGKVGGWEHDLQSGQVIWDDETYNIYGFDKSTIELYEKMKASIHPEDRERVLELISKVDQLNNFEYEYKTITPKDEVKHIRLTVEVEKNEKSEVIKQFGLAQDITEKKIQDIRQKELTDITSYQNNKLKNFAYIVSHNMRSHSANISSLIEMIDNATDEEQKATMMDMLRKSAANLDDTLRNLNDIISITENFSKSKERYNLKQEIDKTLQVLSGQIYQFQVEVNVEIGSDIEVIAVKSYLESIFLNIISNAIKYKSPNRMPKIAIHTYQDKDYQVVEIRDNGMGIDLKKVGNKIFGMYKTFHQNEDARGLGLFITKNQIESMKGKIEVESEVDKGTAFKIYFYREQ